MWRVLLAGSVPFALAESDACTSIAVGPKATVEGSGFATHTNDCQTCDPRVARIPAKDYEPGSMRPVAPFRLEYPRFVGADRSATYAAEVGQSDTVPIGYIPQVAHTYAYWEASYPLLNEHGLGFGESTCAAKLVGVSRAQGGQAMFSIAELMKIALERCITARCAIQTMGDQAVAHGFFGEEPGMPGAGESLSVVDRHETWVFHIAGGLNGSSATWVAQRVPDDHVAVVTNNFIITKVDCGDRGNFMCSDNIFSNARAAQTCDFTTEAEFEWRRCYGPDIRHFSYFPGIPPVPRYSTLRTWRVHTLANSDVRAVPTEDPDAFPFSVPVKGKVSRAQVMDWMRDHYEGTPYDMTQGILAGPFGNPNRLEGGLGIQTVHGQFARGISIPRTNYGLLVEAKLGDEKASQSIAWFATDVPASSVFVPFFANTSEHAASYSTGRQSVFSRDSAWWAFDFVANYMNINYHNIFTRLVYPAMRSEQAKVLQSVVELEGAWEEQGANAGTRQQALQEALVSRWWQLADEVVVHFNDGVYNFGEGLVEKIGYPAWWLQMIGFSNEFYKPQWVEWTSFPPQLLVDEGVADMSSPQQALRPNGARLLPGFIPGALTGMAIGTGLTLIAVTLLNSVHRRRVADVSEYVKF